MLNKKRNQLSLIIFIIGFFVIQCKPKAKHNKRDLKVIELTDSTFKEFIDNKQITLIYFWAEWCGYCTKFAPTVEALASETDIELGKVNVDNCPETFLKYKEKYIPMIIIFKNGEIQDKIVGTTPKEEILERIKKIGSTDKSTPLG